MEGTGTKAALEGPIALMKAQPCARLVKAFRGLDGAVVARLLHKCSEVLRESLCTGSDKDAQLCTGAAVTVQVLLAAKPGLLSEETLRNLVMKKDSKGKWKDCLLYTSDAADEEDSVDLGGRRIIKKKKKKEKKSLYISK
eukprot:TRINITY_DN7589_c0_g1_i9.p2 TRINITY_DN7589_c0_g1~~TRINITY_DN7589_c0_g1_i9.p2  ORF type:complete len:140 (+),score=48.67 TRINITY_DN7589_c0_g1_i9:284-703(+)